MHVTALVDSLDHVCCRYRVAPFRPIFARAGFELDTVTLPSRLWPRLKLFRSLRHSDVIILQRRLLPSWQLHILRHASQRMIFDFDDAVFLRDSFSTKGLQSWRRLRRFRAAVRHSDVVVAGNEFLLAQARAACPLVKGVVIPTCVDPGHYSPAQHQNPPDSIELVWIGSSSTLQGLAQVQPMLEEWGRLLGGVRLKLVCDHFLNLKHLPVVARRWTESSEASELAGADIGISWMPDDPWSRGKCGLKVLQYMAAGLPVIANPVGVHCSMVLDGETGFLADSPGEWIQAIKTLAGNPQLRLRMGEAARLRVARDFSVDAASARWLALLNDIQIQPKVA